MYEKIIIMLEQVFRMTGVVPERCNVDRGYRGYGADRASVFISGQRRGVTRRSKKNCGPG